jgi:hypothetical protein
MSMIKDRVAVYIDGFNLYYGALKDEPHRWLDIEALAKSFLTQRQILVDVKYFTAKVQDTPEKPGQRARQEKYLRAVGTLPKVTIYYGHFQTRTAVRLLEHPPKPPPGRYRPALGLAPGGEGVRREFGNAANRRWAPRSL